MNDSGQHANRRFSVGLTGGIGSGKTTVANLFAECGAAVVDTDAIAHALTAPGGLAIAPIRAQFGAGVIDAGGALDRVRMRELVFAEPSSRKRLEAILHPLIRQECEREAQAAPGDYVIFVVPLLIESPYWRERVGRVLVIDCPEALQVQRVSERSGMTPDQVRAVMAAQASRAERLAAADDVIVNDAGGDKLGPQVKLLHRLYLRLAAPTLPE